MPPRKIEIIPHGIPDFPFLEPHHAKAKLGLVGKTILTFGLLSPSKGIENVIDLFLRRVSAHIDDHSENASCLFPRNKKAS